MTTVVTTKDFLDAFFVNFDKDEYHNDLYQFITKDIFGFKLICDFASTEELQSAIEENPFWELLLDKYDKINFNPNITHELKNKTFYEDLNENNLFFTTLSLNECQSLSQSFGYIFVTAEDITTTWKPYKFVRENSFMKVTRDSAFPNNSKFNNWDKLDNYLLPLTSIVIFDYLNH